jgi:energy-coupling factor transport system ATP-binding protein
MTVIISAEGLSHCYHAGKENALVALSEVGLTLEAGEFVAIVGANGSGKSTLAKHFNALLLPTAGRVTCAGPPGWCFRTLTTSWWPRWWRKTWPSDRRTWA